MEKWKNRLTEFPISEFFLTRVSTRALDPTRKIEKPLLMSLFEAAKWAPSCYNNQPWRYLFAYKGSEAFEVLFATLVEFNQSWCKNASVLCLVTSRTLFSRNNKESKTASLDTGSSLMNLILEAHVRGLVAHPMEGFSREKAREAFNIPEIFKVEAMVALGYPGEPSLLPSEMQEGEKPSSRLNLKEIVSEGAFPFG